MSEPKEGQEKSPDVKRWIWRIAFYFKFVPIAGPGAVLSVPLMLLSLFLPPALAHKILIIGLAGFGVSLLVGAIWTVPLLWKARKLLMERKQSRSP